MKRRVFIASAPAALALPARAATTIRFVTDWKAQAEHGGFYQAIAQGLYAKRDLEVKILQGGPDVNVPQLLAGGAADFGMGSNSFIALNLVKQNIPIRAVMAIFQKDPQVLISHPRRDLNSLADMKGQADPDLGRDHERLLAVAEGEVRFQRHPDPQIHLQPGALHRRSQRHPGRLSDQRAVHGAATGRISRPRFSCWPITAIPVTPTWCWCRKSGSTPTAPPCRALSMPPATAG